MHKQSGSLLLEYMVVVMLATVMAVGAVEHLQRQMREQLLSSSINWGLQLREAAQDYLHALSQARAGQIDWLVAWPYKDWRRPRLDELQTQGLLSASFPLHSVLGGMQLYVQESAHCETQPCRLDALLVMQPMTAFAWVAQPHYQTLWKLQSQGYGLTVAGEGKSFNGPGGQWNNPLGGDIPSFPVGSVGLSVYKNNMRTEEFLSVGDVRDPSFRGGLTVREDISSMQDLHATRALRIDGQAHHKSACKMDQAVMRDAAGPGLLVCHQGYWQVMGGVNGGAYSQHTSYECHTGPYGLTQKNPVTGNCDCPPDYFALLMAEDTVQEGVRRSYLCIR